QPGAALLPAAEAPSVALQGCSKLAFEPSIRLATPPREAGMPSGLTLEVRVPQAGTLSASELTAADIKNAAIELPEGMAASIAAADGLATCGVTESGFLGLPGDAGNQLEAELEAQRFTPLSTTCPNASTIGE